MAARRISAPFLTILQRSSVGTGSSTSLPALAVPFQGRLFARRGLLSDAQAKADNEETRDYESEKMINEGGGSVEESYEKKSDELKHRQEQTKGVVKDVASESSQKVDEAKEKVKETTAEAGGKATEAKEKVKETTAEAGGKATEATNQAKEKVKETTAEAGEKAAEAKNQATGQVAKNVDTAKEMFKDMPQKVSETATGLKEVGVEAAKAVKRDTEKLAQKAGLKTE